MCCGGGLEALVEECGEGSLSSGGVLLGLYVVNA